MITRLYSVIKFSNSLFVVAPAGKFPEAHSTELVLVQLLLTHETLETFEMSEKRRVTSKFVDVAIGDGLATDVAAIFCNTKGKVLNQYVE